MTPETTSDVVPKAGPLAPYDVADGAVLKDVGATDASLRRFLRGLPPVDPVGVEMRAAGLATRSLKRETKRAMIDLAISMVDLTTLEGADTAGKVHGLARKAIQPDPEHLDTPSAAAVCVYPDVVPAAVEALVGTGVRVASVATAFPAGRSSLEVKLADTLLAVEAGADEIDMVIDRAAFLVGDYGRVHDQILAVKQASGAARLKVILETGELATYDNVRRASWLALLAGADFIKTSTGKIAPAATLPVTQVMLQAVRDWRALTGEQRGVKPAGGIRTTKDALRYLVLVHEVAGPEWLDPHWFRFGASSVLNDLVMQRRTQLAGRYSGPLYVTVD
jgi:deoxyribose-phosphate aldolase